MTVASAFCVEFTTAQSEAKTKAEINRLESNQPSQDSKQDKAPHYPKRAPLPDHLPRERIVLPSPSVCPCCNGSRHHAPGEMARLARPR
jgi:transposase